MIGKILNGRYEILEEIGKGGMAIVYKARCVLLNRIVAVKILREDLEGGEEFIERFNAEAHAAASLDHSNIVSIFDVGTDDGRHYITMEFVEGQTLKEYISQKGHLPYNEALSVALQISDALTAAHQKNIVHRDIKPHNILITKDGKIKVTDFGIARFGTSNTLSTTNDILGSVHYISPEQAKGMAVDSRSDIYSLGVVIYEMLSGKVPFDGDNPVSVAMMQIENSPAEITDFVNNVPVSAQHIAFKAMSKDPDLRYQTADEFKIDIISVLKDPSIIIDKRFLYENLNPEPESKIEIPKKEEVVTKTSTKVLMITLAAISSFVLVFGAYIFGRALINNPAGFFSNLFSASSNEVAVPDLTGKTVEEAQKICDDMGLALFIEDEVEDDSKLPGTVVNQTPSPAQKVAADKMINVVVTKSFSYSELKDYTGRSFEGAIKELDNLGLEYNLIYDKTSHKADGTVIKQEPQKGELVKQGTVITLYVSGEEKDEEENMVEVPDIVGKTYLEAKLEIDEAKLEVGDLLGNSKPLADEIVVAQSPSAGAKVRKNTDISLTFERKSNKPTDNSANSSDISSTKSVEENSSESSEQSSRDDLPGSTANSEVN